MADIVRALQAFTHEPTSPPRRLELANVATDAVRLVRLVAATPDVELTVRREAEPVVVAAPGAVAQAIVAALLDALATAERGRTLGIVVSEQAGVAVVTVAGDEVLRLPLEAAA